MWSDRSVSLRRCRGKQLPQIQVLPSPPRCEEQLPSPHLLSFQTFPHDCLNPHQSSHSLSSFHRGLFHYFFFFSLWKSSLHFVCPAINFSCFIQVPIFLKEPLSTFSLYYRGLQILAPGNPSLADWPCPISGHSDWLKNGHIHV